MLPTHTHMYIYNTNTQPPTPPPQAASGKFTPIKQFFLFDAMECLPPQPLPEAEVQPLGCRYDGQIMVFGRGLQVS